MASQKNVVLLTSFATGFAKTKKDIQSVKFLLQKKDVVFTQVDAGVEVEERDRLRTISGTKVLPQVFVDDVFIGSAEELQDLEEEGRLDEVLGLSS